MAADRLIQRTLATLRDLRDQAIGFAEEHSRAVDVVDARHANSVRNLLHYLSIRQSDIRELQQDLHSLGLSSLGVLEALEDVGPEGVGLLAELALEAREALVGGAALLTEEQVAAAEETIKQGQGEIQTVFRNREKLLQLSAARLDALREYHLARVRYEAAKGSF